LTAAGLPQRPTAPRTDETVAFRAAAPPPYGGAARPAPGRAQAESGSAGQSGRASTPSESSMSYGESARSAKTGWDIDARPAGSGSTWDASQPPARPANGGWDIDGGPDTRSNAGPEQRTEPEPRPAAGSSAPASLWDPLPPDAPAPEFGVRRGLSSTGTARAPESSRSPRPADAARFPDAPARPFDAEQTTDLSRFGGARPDSIRFGGRPAPEPAEPTETGLGLQAAAPTSTPPDPPAAEPPTEGPDTAGGSGERSDALGGVLEGWAATSDSVLRRWAESGSVDSESWRATRPGGSNSSADGESHQSTAERAGPDSYESWISSLRAGEPVSRGGGAKPDETEAAEEPPTERWRIPGQRADPEPAPATTPAPATSPATAPAAGPVESGGRREGEPEVPFEPANDVEANLLAAASDGHTDNFLSTLLLARVFVPVPPGADTGALPGTPAFEWRQEDVDGQPYVVVFTSAERMAGRLGAGTNAVAVKFVQLISAWPEESWSFAVNPGTPVGATLPGTQIRALAAWAAEVGLTDEPLVEYEPAPVPVTGKSGPAPQNVVVMQKPIAASQVSYFLERGYDRVSGFVHRATEVEHLTTPEQMHVALGLGYAGSPFKPTDDEIFILRWSAHRPNLYRIPYGGRDEAGMRAMQGWMIERSPYRGNGFAPSESRDVIAEFKVDSARLPHGAQMWRASRDGSPTLVAVLDTDGPRWVPVVADDGPTGDVPDVES
jgi:hypothetical protein